MFEKINESVEVVAKFSGAQVMPTFLKWRGKTYRIEKLNLVHKEKQGGDTTYYFSVSDRINFFRLAFFTGDLSWHLEELYWEG